MTSSEADRPGSDTTPDSGPVSKDGSFHIDVDLTPDDDTSSRRRSRGRWVGAGIVVLLALVAAGWFFFVRNGEPAGPPAPVLETTIETPLSGAVVVTDWSSPSAVAVGGDRIYILDTGNNRILSMDREGVVDNIICETDECALLLDAPQDMEYHEGLFYVANTEKGQVDVVDATGTIIRTYELPAEPGDLPRATGVHVADDGSVYVSDWTSGRVAIFEPDGAFRLYFGEDTVGVFEFTDPTGLMLDDDGNLYIAEFSLGLVRKISPVGRELAIFSMMGSVTTASEASDLIIDDNGFLYLADSKRSVVHVFSRGARRLGLIGFLDASRSDSPLALLRPQGLATDGNQLFVIDSERGLQIYIIDPNYFLFQRTE
ncbi:MAG: NHL repeat-containing protein [Actinomycetia bacterium]|nr:NHL repeat-containing protein [Actinomycetes bacterium]